MAKNDYFVIAYRILAYLYACLKSDETPDESEISPAKLDIKPGYWLYIMENMQLSGYITGVHIGKLIGGAPAVKLADLKITPDGIAYLQENSTMEKAKNFLKAMKEIIPGLS